MQLDKGFQFLSYQVLAERNIVLGPDGEQKIEPKAMRVLLFLASQPEQVVSRQALLDEVWAETYSGDEALTRCISLLRTAFGGKKNHVIETVPKVGYRFVAPISPIDKAINEETAAKIQAPLETPSLTEQPQQVHVEIQQATKRFKPLLMMSVAALILTLLYVGISHDRGSTASNSIAQNPVESSSGLNAEKAKLEGTSIAVMPFVNMSGDPDNEYFSDGISEEILNILAQVPNLKVISRSSAFSFKGKDVLLSEVADKLGVNNILEGSVRKIGDRVRITAQLIEANTDTHLWSKTYDRELNDVFKVQDDIARQIVTMLEEKLGVTNLVEWDMQGVSSEAHSEFVKGRFFVARQSKKDIERAITHFTNAIDFAPDYAQAWAEKSRAHMLLELGYHGSTEQEEAIAKARPAAEKALALAPNLPAAHVALGVIEGSRGNNNLAQKHFSEALKRNPNNVDAIRWLANVTYSETGMNNIINLRREAILIDPMSLRDNYLYALELIFIGQLKEATEVIKHMFTISPKSIAAAQVFAYLREAQAKYGEAAYIYHQVLRNKPKDLSFRLAHMAGFALANLNHGEAAESLVAQTDFAFHSPYFGNEFDKWLANYRTIFPRNEKDGLSLHLRATAEALAGNYETAVSFFDKTNFCTDCNSTEMYSYIKTNRKYVIKERLEARKLRLEVATEKMHVLIRETTNTYALWNPIKLESTIIAYLENDINLAISHLEGAVNDGVIITHDLKRMQLYKDLREHPRWPELLAKSEAIVAKEIKIYQQLIEDNVPLENLL